VLRRPRIALLALFVALGCASAQKHSPDAPLPSQSPTELPLRAQNELPRLEMEGSFVELEVPGHRPAWVGVPRDTRSPAPVLVVSHGAGGRPEPHCAFWRKVVGERGFLLCPRGVALGTARDGEEQGYFFPNHHALDREVVAALSALAARFGEHVDLRAPIYAGFSQGATMGALAFVNKSTRFERMIFVEGGVGEAEEWTIAGARAFHEGGGARVLFACGRARCLEAARRSARYVEKAGLETRVVFGRGAGHSYGGAVADGLMEAFSWVIEGDSRWQSSHRTD